MTQPRPPWWAYVVVPGLMLAAAVLAVLIVVGLVRWVTTP